MLFMLLNTCILFAEAYHSFWHYQNNQFAGIRNTSHSLVYKSKIKSFKVVRR